jgi:hypothetical protein
MRVALAFSVFAAVIAVAIVALAAAIGGALIALDGFTHSLASGSLQIRCMFDPRFYADRTKQELFKQSTSGLGENGVAKIFAFCIKISRGLVECVFKIFSYKLAFFHCVAPGHWRAMSARCCLMFP